MENKKSKNLKQLGFFLIAIFLVNFASYFIFHRFDLTSDKRYTLSDATKKIVNQVKVPIVIDVFLEGDLPLEFKRLQSETKQLLEEFSSLNGNINFQFINPLEKEENKIETMKSFYRKEMMPVDLTINQKGKQIQVVAFPWAVINNNEKSAKIKLLQQKMGDQTTTKSVENTVQYLEYAFAEALNKVTAEKQRKIAVITGNGELEDQYIASFLKSISESYKLGKITLDSVAKNPINVQKALGIYDMALIAKPREKFSEQEKLVIDQFIMKGGKTLWLVDGVNVEMSDLNKTGETVALPNDLNLTDMFFRYGFRINPYLIKDEYGTPIKLSTGNTNNPDEMQMFNWKYAPFIYPSGKSNIVKNIEGLKLEFCSPIEVLKNKINKTLLLETSNKSKIIGLPHLVSLASVTEETNAKDYVQGGFFPTAILFEGNFTSVYKNRVLPFKPEKFTETSIKTQMIVVGDGDIIKNQLDRGQPQELGFDKWTKQTFGNKEFLLNSINYLLDDTGLINIRNKEVRLPILSQEKLEKHYSIAQIVAVAIPLLLLLIFGILFTFWRKQKYTKVC